MRIKTYMADNMQEAFYKVKKDMGDDAIILQTKQVKKGGFLGLFAKPMVEVVAVKDVKLSPNFNRPKSSKNILDKTKSKSKSDKSGKQNLENIKNDIDEVKGLLQALYKNQHTQLNIPYESLSGHLKKYYTIMKNMYVNSDIIKSILKQTTDTLSKEDLNDEKKVVKVIRDQIAKKIGKVEPIKLQDNSNTIVAFVGPTGVGKTTTIAKLAANYTLYHDKKVAMVTADTFRVGAVEQLKLYGDLLEIPVIVLYSPSDITDVLQNLNEYDLTLVDTMGSSPNNKMQIKKVKGFLEKLNPTDIHMVISATTKNQDIYDILNNYSELNYQKLIITKLDETTTYGFILNILDRSDCNLSYVTTGQNVPDDIEMANVENMVNLILGDNK